MWQGAGTRLAKRDDSGKDGSRGKQDGSMARERGKGCHVRTRGFAERKLLLTNAGAGDAVRRRPGKLDAWSGRGKKKAPPWRGFPIPAFPANPDYFSRSARI